MSKFYDDVKKQGTQIDDLQKKVTDHGTRIETLETQAMAIPPQSPVNIPVPKVTVTVPDNIATKENINSLLETAIEKQTKITVKTISDMFKMLLPNGNIPQGIDEAKLEEIAQKAADKAASKRHTQLEATAGNTHAPYVQSCQRCCLGGNPPVGIYRFRNCGACRRRLRLWLLPPAQRKLQAERCRMALSL